MRIEEKEYSRKEISTLLGITSKTLSNTKAKYLNYLSTFCTFQILDEGKRNERYKIIDILVEDHEIVSMRENRKLKKTKNYSKAIVKSIEKSPIRTYINISRSISNIPDIIELKYKESTRYKYVSEFMKIFFGPVICDGHGHFPGGLLGTVKWKIWCYWNEDTGNYVPMSDEDNNFFHQCFRDAENDIDEQRLEICAAYRQKEITKEERDEQLGDIEYNTYLLGRQKFFEEKNYVPECVPEYIFHEDYKQLLENFIQAHEQYS